MLRFTFPYLFFVSLTAFAGGILNTYGRFGVPAFTPVILNVVLIVAAIWIAPMLETPVMALAYAIFIAGLLQLLFQLPFLARIRVLPRPKWRPSNRGVKRAFSLMLPAIFGSSVAQINVLLSGIVASLLPVGSISYLYYSDRLMEFPLGLFGIALATVTLPYLSRLWVNNDRVAFAATLDWSMRLALLIAVPASVGLIMLAAPLVVTLFHGGAFDERAVNMTAMALQAYAVGLVGFSFVKVLAPAFFAREDTRTPVKIGLLALATNLVVGVSLAFYFVSSEFAGPHLGLAVATSLAAVLNALLLYRSLHTARVLSHRAGWFGYAVRIGLANAVMCAVLWQLARPLNWWLSSAGWDRSLWIGLTVAAGAASYVASLFVFGLRTSQLRLEKS